MEPMGNDVQTHSARTHARGTHRASETCMLRLKNLFVQRISDLRFCTAEP